MNNKNQFKSIGFFIILSAIVWGAVLIGCSYKLKGTGCYNEISQILYAGTAIHLVLIWGPIAAIFRKKDGNEE